jgi:hypothetical protein
MSELVFSQPFPRVAGPLVRPQYDNRRVVNFTAWFGDNRRNLIRWWWQCDLALKLQGAEPGNAADDFDLFCQCQHEREQRKSVQS